jgi:hypothetical protein
MRALYLYGIYKRETDLEAVIGVTEGNEALMGVLIVNSTLPMRHAAVNCGGLT